MALGLQRGRLPWQVHGDAGPGLAGPRHHRLRPVGWRRGGSPGRRPGHVRRSGRRHRRPVRPAPRPHGLPLPPRGRGVASGRRGAHRQPSPGHDPGRSPCPGHPAVGPSAHQQRAHLRRRRPGAAAERHRGPHDGLQPGPHPRLAGRRPPHRQGRRGVLLPRAGRGHVRRGAAAAPGPPRAAGRPIPGVPLAHAGGGHPVRPGQPPGGLAPLPQPPHGGLRLLIPHHAAGHGPRRARRRRDGAGHPLRGVERRRAGQPVRPHGAAGVQGPWRVHGRQRRRRGPVPSPLCPVAVVPGVRGPGGLHRRNPLRLRRHHGCPAAAPLVGRHARAGAGPLRPDLRLHARRRVHCGRGGDGGEPALCTLAWAAASSWSGSCASGPLSAATGGTRSPARC